MYYLILIGEDIALNVTSWMNNEAMNAQIHTNAKRKPIKQYGANYGSYRTSKA